MAHSSAPSIVLERKVFEPVDLEELLKGWLLHAHKGRERHDRAARSSDRNRLWIGGAAAILSAVVGTTVFGALERETSITVRAIVGAVSIIAAILTGLSGFLNLSERTEKHRMAGVRYKIAVRDLERLLSAPLTALTRDSQPILEIQKKLDDLEETAPVMPERIFDRVDNDWRNAGAEFVGSADKLYQRDA